MAPETFTTRMTPPELREVSVFRRAVAFTLFVVAVVVSAAMLVTAGSGCGTGAKGCAVVDASKVVIDQAAEACVVLRYLDEGGHVREEHVSAAEIRTLGERAAARRVSAAASAPH